MDAQGYCTRWRENAERRGVLPHAVTEIGRRHDITRSSFAVLARMQEIRDPAGQSFFLLPPGARGGEARAAVLMTYILNAGTGYGAKGKRPTDFPATPYSAAEVTRIRLRQHANAWSYGRDVPFVHRNGGRLVTTPNGMLMGLGGNWIQWLFSQRGGTTWGEIFMVNLGRVTDPAEQLRRVVASGHTWCLDGDGAPRCTRLDLDRVLHHEERHAQQWAARGYLGMLTGYGRELFRELAFGTINRLEADAGLADGGYRA
ncbi:hypothetical protein QRB36_15610 [Mycobacterium marseillense]|uniref:hypothetical protein n=1 Tax=Mycobacterium marseillense TaxID=701042 RepID=UPI00259990E5|nr:hypothetical protein [Mycobacterium marseillense]MDM3975595.1 hypothetical protein [Mycobacterium marseillense]